MIICEKQNNAMKSTVGTYDNEYYVYSRRVSARSYYLPILSADTSIAMLSDPLGCACMISISIFAGPMAI
mgnify:CR=1 FL=1